MNVPWQFVFQLKQRCQKQRYNNQRADFFLFTPSVYSEWRNTDVLHITGRPFETHFIKNDFGLASEVKLTIQPSLIFIIKQVFECLQLPPF